MPDKRQRRDIDDEDADARLLARVLILAAEAEEIQAIAGGRPGEHRVVAALGCGHRPPPDRRVSAGRARTRGKLRCGVEMDSRRVQGREVDPGENEVRR